MCNDKILPGYAFIQTTSTAILSSHGKDIEFENIILKSDGILLACWIKTMKYYNNKNFQQN